LARAEQLYQQALAIEEKLAPNSLQVATTLHNLGSVAADRGDLARAEQLYQQALAIREKLAPNSLDVAGTLQNLANLARQQKNYPQAQRYLARALEIYETQRAAIPDPETKTAFAERYFNAYTLQAQLALDQQQPQQAALALERSRARTLAELMFTRALPVPTNAPQALKDLIAQQEQLQRDFLLLARQQRKLAPNSLYVAGTLLNLGSVAQDRGDLVHAEQLFQQALAIYEKLAPNSLDVAQTLRNLAILARRQKNYSQAQHHLQRALKIYETQRTTIQDPETKAAFAERYFNAYTLQAQLALDHGGRRCAGVLGWCGWA
jgi:tetratricopeptide (TPR) repeat protein